MQIRERLTEIFIFLTIASLALPNQLKPQILPLFLQMCNVFIRSFSSLLSHSLPAIILMLLNVCFSLCREFSHPEYYFWQTYLGLNPNVAPGGSLL